MQDLTKGYAFKTPQEWDNEQVKRYDTVHEDGTWTVALVKNELPSLKEMSYLQKRLLLDNRNLKNESGIIVKYNGPESIFIGSYEKSFRTVGRKIFAKKIWIHVVRWDGKRIITNKCYKNATSEFHSVLFHLFGLEGAYERDKDGNTTNGHLIHLVFGNKTVLKGVFSRKITNLRDATKSWLASSCKLKFSDVSYKTLKQYLAETCEGAADIINYADFTTSVEMTLRRLTEWTADKNAKSEKAYTTRDKKTRERYEREYRETEQRLTTFRDILEQAYKLDVKVNPNWTQRRMQEEHEKLTFALMHAKGEKLSTDSIYDLPDNRINEKSKSGVRLIGSILNDEMHIHAEGLSMHHCIYTNYFEKIREKHYVALSITAPERVTVGITSAKYKPWHQEEYEENDILIDQMHTRHNGNPSKLTRKLIENWFKANKALFENIIDINDADTKERVAVPVQLDEDFPF